MKKEEKVKKKKLFRSKEDKVIAGVCGGIAEYLAIDPVWVRLLAVLLLFADGIGIILYIVAVLLIPEEKDYIDIKAEKVGKKEKTVKTEKKVSNKSGLSDSPNSRGNASGRDGSVVFGMICIAIGTVAFLKKFIPWLSFAYLVPLGLVILGIMMIVGEKR